MSPATGVLDLPTDILDRILQCSPTFKTLYAAIRVSKVWYQVFETHPKSIVHAVTENDVGPALPEAMALLRYSAASKQCGDPDLGDEDADDDEQESSGKSNCEMGRKEYALLRKNAAVVKDLEVAFSMRYRDKLDRTSQLTWAESWRFARAMYRIMLYCAVFRMYDDEDGVRELENQHDVIEAQRFAMLDAFSTEELVELNAALVFLGDIADEATGKAGNYFDDDDDDDDDDDVPEGVREWFLSAGPAAILKAHQYKEADVLVERIGYTVWLAGPFMLLSGYFATPLHMIWDSRGIAAPVESDVEQNNPLLDAPVIRSVPCDRCAHVCSSKLWHEHNWDALHLEPRVLLKGKLADNFTEIEYLDAAKPSKNIPKLISDIYTLATEDFKDWKKSESLCGGCLTKFLSAHLHLWLFEYKVKDGWDAPEDCWYGYECRTQTSVTLHALTKNHLCKPRPCNGN
ncbi:hypothetical protein FB451DRAFT_722014 [Mycena latifolia]|nr:hypothetical protein FB451DRAFT_722014 [Mycena latifolia]